MTGQAHAAGTHDPALLTLIDTHAHLDAQEFDADRGEVIRRAQQAGVRAIVCPALSARSSAAVVHLAGQCPGIYAAVGIHPNLCAEAEAADWEKVSRLAGGSGVVAIGETGLDRYRDFAPLHLQQEYFERHLELASQLALPVIMHCRQAEAEVLAILRRAAGQGSLSGVIHAFSGDRGFAEECLALGLHLSFAGSVTYTNRKFASLREAARAVPAQRLLIETDSPYLVPHPLRGKQNRNEPARLVHTASALAELRGVSPQELAASTTAAACRLFRLPGGA